MKNWLKRKLRKWLFPEYDEVCLFMGEMNEAKRKAIADADSPGISIAGPLVLVGSLVNCKVDVKPTIKPRIVLSELVLKDLLSVGGSNQIVSGCYFGGKEAPVTKFGIFREP